MIEATVDMVPLGTIAPFTDRERIPEGFSTLEGQRFERSEYPEFVHRMWSALHEGNLLADGVFKTVYERFWVANGGEINSDYVQLPFFDEDDMWTHVWGILKPKNWQGTTPALIIKVQRSNNSQDGGAGEMDRDDPATG